MADPMHLWSEPFPPSGGITATGVKNALGRPHMDLPTLLIRETVQNSWDARRPQVRPITFRIDAWTMTGPELENLRSLVFAEQKVPGLKLDTILEQQRVAVVVISDRGTTGLGGATRADIVTTEPSDFADFVRNVGQPPDKARGGGTYGYGKAVLFLASEASTIIAYSRCMAQGVAESRLIGIGLGEPHSTLGDGVERRYTGRHWWGVEDAVAGIEPVTGDAADEIAQLIGMPGFSPGEYGTSVMLIGASFGGVDLGSAVAEMCEALLWYCWPKMVAIGEEGVEIDFEVTLEGESCPPPDPATHPDLRGFVEAYRAARGADRDARDSLQARVETIRSERPRQDLGRLGIVQYLRDERLPDDVPARPFTGPPHHVALMRHPRLVVTYLSGPEPPVAGVAWAGVFVADEAVDRAFAAAEPPSHDDWTPDILPRSREKTFVNVALRNIRDTVRLFSRPEAPADSSATVSPLAGIAAALGGVLWGDSGPGTRFLSSIDKHTEGGGGLGGVGVSGGAGAGGGGGGTGGRGGTVIQRRRVARVSMVRHELVVDEGIPALNVTFQVSPAPGAARTRVHAVPAVTVNDGSTLEREEPVGAERPRVLHWQVGENTFTSTDIVLDSDTDVEAEVRVSIPSDTTVAVSITAETIEEPGR